MKEMRNILGWLGMAEQREIMTAAESHIAETCKTVFHLAEAVKAFVAGDLSARTVAIENVRQSERAADKLKARMIGQLSVDLLMPPDRADLIRLANALDKIADSTNRAARLLWFIEEKLPDNILKHMSVSTELIVAAVAKLRNAISAMSQNQIQAAMENCVEVERIEHEADDQKRNLLDSILRAQLQAATLLLCYNLAEALEGVTDKVETASDLINLLAVKAK